MSSGLQQEHKSTQSDTTANPAPQRAWDRVVLVAAAVLVSLFGAVFILRPDNLLADDSYFYLQVAWNFARGMGSTFNNLMPTNGYHPLWMLVCAAVYKVFPQKVVGIHAVAGVVVLLDAAMLWTVRHLLRSTGSALWTIALLVLIPFSFMTQLGTEGALSGLFLSLLMLAGYRYLLAPGAGRAVLFHLVAALAVLSRLDNIFIVFWVWLAVTAAVWKSGKRWLQFATLPIYLVLWGAYLGSNRIYFHLWQPISGMLKSNSGLTHHLGSHFPHIPLLAAALILIGLAGLGWTRRDRFFYFIELPFAAGILCHALYIQLRMSNETRWSWYYTSWVLLAAVLMARLLGQMLKDRRQGAMFLGAACLLVLSVLWVRIDYQEHYRGLDKRTGALEFAKAARLAGIHRILAFDQPGRLAYYSDVQIIPLDGLMGDMHLQTDLATMGIQKYVRLNHIDGFLGPADPAPAYDAKQMCGTIYLASVNFQCQPSSQQPGWSHVTGVRVYSRVPAADAGLLPLPEQDLVWSPSGYLGLWRLQP